MSSRRTLPPLETLKKASQRSVFRVLCLETLKKASQRSVFRVLCVETPKKASQRSVIRLLCLEKKRKDYIFRRQFIEKPSIIPGCPGLVSTCVYVSEGFRQLYIVSTSVTLWHTLLWCLL